MSAALSPIVNHRHYQFNGKESYFSKTVFTLFARLHNTEQLFAEIAAAEREKRRKRRRGGEIVRNTFITRKK